MSKQEKPKAIAYLRVGSRQQLGDPNMGSDKQKLQIMAAASRLKLEIVMWFEITGQSHVTDKVVRDMLAYCELFPEIEYLILTSPDRLTRSVTDYFVIKDAFQKVGVTIVSAHNEGELNSPYRQLSDLLMIGLAQMAHDEQSARVKRALQRKKEQENKETGA